MFIYNIVKDRTNIDWTNYERVLSDIGIETIDDELEANIRKIIQEYMENTKEEQYGDTNNDGIVTDDDLTPEEQDIMSTDTGDDY